MVDKTYDKEKLIQFLRDLDEILTNEHLSNPIDIITLGGSAMSLLGFRTKTKDMDFFYRGIDYETFSKAVEKLYGKYREKEIDFWEDGVMQVARKGTIISQQLPLDYYDISLEERIHFKNIRLKILNPVDIILTKMGRADDDDIKDMKFLIEKFDIKKPRLVSRFKIYEQNFTGNVEALRKKFNDTINELYEP